MHGQSMEQISMTSALEQQTQAPSAKLVAYVEEFRTPGEPRINAMARLSTISDVSINTIRKALDGGRLSERTAVKLERATRGAVPARELM